MFLYFINQAPAETESPNVFDEPVASERPSNLSVPVATLNPAIQERCSKLSHFGEQSISEISFFYREKDPFIHFFATSLISDDQAKVRIDQ